MTNHSEAPTPSKIDFATESLRTRNYIRQRTKPCLSDLNFLHLKDLLQVVRSLATGVRGDVFDYGCGGAPYRDLFSSCRSYVAADVNQGPQVDRILRNDGMTSEADASYDLVFSTQVLEHVKDPFLYLLEAHRILRPGGQIVLTTHGMYEEHGTPWDFHRWTGIGLEQLAQRAGFRIIESAKLTTEIRAVVQLLHQLTLHLRSSEKRFLHLILAVIRRIYTILLVPSLNWFAELFPKQASVPAHDPASLYVCLYIRAEKIDTSDSN